MELIDTIDGMTSSDYKERMKAEYQQVKIRYFKLKKYCNKIEAGQMIDDAEMEPPHDCPLRLLQKQLRIMGQYMHVLEVRAEIEGVSLE